MLGICLGLQLALDWTDEDGGVDGLGLVPGPRAAPRGAACRASAGREVDDRGAFYFAHSYAADTPRATAWSEGVVAEVRSGSFVGCQFHPEKSGAGAA